jgi:hypothetical protein
MNYERVLALVRKNDARLLKNIVKLPIKIVKNFDELKSEYRLNDFVILSLYLARFKKTVDEIKSLSNIKFHLLALGDHEVMTSCQALIMDEFNVEPGQYTIDELMKCATGEVESLWKSFRENSTVTVRYEL